MICNDTSEAPVEIEAFELSSETVERIRADAERAGVSLENAPISVVVPMESNQVGLGMAEGEDSGSFTKFGPLEGTSLFSVAFYVGFGSRVTCCSIGGRRWCRRWG